MGKYDYQKSYARQMETIVLIISVIYGLSEVMKAYIAKWNPWAQVFIVACVFYTCMVYVGKYWTYEIRAYVTTGMSLLTMVVYAIEIGNLIEILPTFVSLCILLGLYGIPKVMINSVVAYTLILLYYIFGNHYLNAELFESNKGMPMVIIQGYLVQFVVFYLVYRYKVTQESMLEMIDALRKSEREKDDFLANVSHEIRTPINTICGISELMLNKDLPKEIRDEILSIQSAGRNLTLVVGDILDYSELQEGEFELVEENYYLSSTINDIINMTMAKKSDKNLELVVNCDADMPNILIGDEQKLRRVIMNLVNNAIEFTSEGGVCIEFGFRREEYGINLIVTVRDTGIGIAKENIEKLFQKFSQADMSRNRAKGGVGLGLAIAQAIINKMGGFITVRSELGKGSEFRFVVPQKVFEDKPLVEIPNKTEINAAVYINMEQFGNPAVRDEYSQNIRHIIEQSGARGRVFRNLTEMKRWTKREVYNQIFISMVEYREDPVFFDNLSMQTNVSIILDHYDDFEVQNKLIYKIYKPFSILSIATMIKAQIAKEDDTYIVDDNHMLYAPEAHILVIDDNRMNIRVVEGFLKEYGLQVAWALSGAEGIRMLEEKEYDLVLLDHMMPEMDGVETLHNIRKKQDPYFKEVPIVALTANAIAGNREMLIKEGFDDFMSKPVESSVLQRTLKRHLPLRKQLNPAKRQVEEKPKVSYVIPNPAPEQGQDTAKTAEPVKLEFGDLDILKGLTYCGNEKNYIEILQAHKESAPEDMKNIQGLFEAEDWKNYTIVVHGIKSSMISIGAVHLSEMAKALELAGKSGDIEYIQKEHEPMMEEYRRVYGILKTSPILGGGEEEETVCDKPEITEEQWETLLNTMEGAMYELNDKLMSAVLEDLSAFSYCGQDIQKALQPVHKKIEMQDLFSAYDTILKIKDKMKKA